MLASMGPENNSKLTKNSSKRYMAEPSPAGFMFSGLTHRSIVERYNMNKIHSAVGSNYFGKKELRKSTRNGVIVPSQVGCIHMDPESLI